MGWFDQAGYNIAPLFGPIGRGIADAIMGGRTAEAVRGVDSAKTLEDFAKLQTPDNIYDPQNLMAIEALRKAKLNELRQLDAAPKLAQFADQYQNIAGTANPRFFGDPESRAEMVKAGLKVPDSTNNPLVSQGVYDFANRGRNADVLANAFAQGQDKPRIDPDILSTLAMDKDLASGFDTTAKGTKVLSEEQAAKDKLQRSRNALDTYVNEPVVQTPESMAGFRGKVMKSAGTFDVAEPLLKRFADVNNPYKDMSEADLTLKAIRGDKEAQQVLSNMQTRKVETALASRPPKSDTGAALYDKRETDKEFQNDLTYLRNLERAVATGGKGMIMIDGVPTSFDGSAESLAMLKQMQSDQDATMRNLYPDKMARRKPQKAAPPAPAPAGKKAADFWKKK